MWRPRAASEPVKLQSPARATVCSHSLSGHGRRPTFDEIRAPSDPLNLAAPKAGVAVGLGVNPSTSSICELASNETSHRREQVENDSSLADQRVGAHHFSRRLSLGAVVYAE